jgi:hypothetical protein
VLVDRMNQRRIRAGTFCQNLLSKRLNMDVCSL